MTDNCTAIKALTYADHLKLIQKVNGNLAVAVDEKHKLLKAFIEEEEQCRWIALCSSLCASGWHTYKAADSYVEMSMGLYRNFGEVGLLRIGSHAAVLCEGALNNCLSYLNALNKVQSICSKESVLAIERVGGMLLSSYPQATNMLQDYYRQAFKLCTDSNYEAWLSIIELHASVDRHSLVNFLVDSESYENVNWCDALPHYLFSFSFGSKYLATIHAVSDALLDVLGEFRTLLQQHQTNEPESDWLESLKNNAKNFSRVDFHVLVRLSVNFDKPVLLKAFLDSAVGLPLHKKRAMVEWIEYANDLAYRNMLAAIAFVKLESVVSINLLKDLTGEILLADHVDKLQLYIDAWSRLPLAITPLTVDKGDQAFVDGLHVFLPASVSMYNTKQENYNLLRLILNHQLGLIEFNTFSDTEINGNYFLAYQDPKLAEKLFSILESARVDWQLQFRYAGLAHLIATAKRSFLEQLLSEQSLLERQRLVIESKLDALIYIQFVSLDLPDADYEESNRGSRFYSLCHLAIQHIKKIGATVADTKHVFNTLYAELLSLPKANLDAFQFVYYRGQIKFNTLNQHFLLHEQTVTAELKENLDDPMLNPDFLEPINATDIEISELDRKAGGYGESMDISVPELQALDDHAKIKKTQAALQTNDNLVGMQKERQQPSVFYYDEWDYQISGYRKNWCTLYEMHELELDADYVKEVLVKQPRLAASVKKQLQQLVPALRRKVYGMNDGEELDLDKVIETLVDRRSGAVPSENIYIQKLRKDRDVSVLFLLDMSASTDDVCQSFMQENTNELRIIDLEKQSIIFIAEALQTLGDQYAICGFSGYGRDQVDFYVCKDFDDKYDFQVKAKIGGIKPCRSTRMGPAIRHSISKLRKTASHTQVLIILSDGYPQDFDYGFDRTDRTYGLQDSTKALKEAARFNIQSFCLTVDPSGQDYLREMCPDKQYMVMQEMSQLPYELSKIYKGLTA